MWIKALTATVVCALALAPSAAAEPPRQPCGESVIADWVADGRVDRAYAPRCYDEALGTLPEDMRAYTTAAGDIAQALRARVRDARPPARVGGRDGDVGGPTSLPLGLVAAGALVLLLAVAGLATLVGRWLHRARLAHRRPLGQW